MFPTHFYEAHETRVVEETFRYEISVYICVHFSQKIQYLKLTDLCGSISAITVRISIKFDFRRINTKDC
jgi:hypothetical protein